MTKTVKCTTQRKYKHGCFDHLLIIPASENTKYHACNALRNHKNVNMVQKVQKEYTRSKVSTKPKQLRRRKRKSRRCINTCLRFYC